MHEALCRLSGTTLDSVHAEDGPPITQRTSGLALCLTAGVASPTAAQQPSSPQAPLPPAPISCDAVKKNMDGDWVTKQDMMLPGPTGPVQIKAGIPLNDDLQDDLDE